MAKYTRKRYTIVLMCPQCNVHLWIRRVGKRIFYQCIKCNYEWEQEQPELSEAIPDEIVQAELPFGEV